MVLSFYSLRFTGFLLRSHLQEHDWNIFCRSSRLMPKLLYVPIHSELFVKEFPADLEIDVRR